VVERAPRHIVVEGPIGVGKTSLARRLAEDFGCELMLEEPGENPFLERFYSHPREAALPTQLYFLMQRMRRIEALRQGDMFNPVQIADFLMEKDCLFAELTLDPQEFELYRQVYSRLTLDAPAPDLVVYLQAPVEVLRRRIARRDRRYERSIQPQYLERVNAAYEAFFHHYDEASLLIVNAGEIDLVSSEPDYRELLERILATDSGRHYFNPLPFAMER
jgi:deoxyguanosine kinase